MNPTLAETHMAGYSPGNPALFTVDGGKRKAME
jgi:hypothetical protein